MIKVWIGLKNDVVRSVYSFDSKTAESEILESGMMPVIHWIPEDLKVIGLTHAGLYSATQQSSKESSDD